MLCMVVLRGNYLAGAMESPWIYLVNYIESIWDLTTISLHAGQM